MGNQQSQRESGCPAAMMYPVEGEDLERSSLIVVPRSIRNRNVVSLQSNQCKMISTAGVSRMATVVGSISPRW